MCDIFYIIIVFCNFYNVFFYLLSQNMKIKELTEKLKTFPEDSEISVLVGNTFVEEFHIFYNVTDEPGSKENKKGMVNLFPKINYSNEDDIEPSFRAKDSNFKFIVFLLLSLMGSAICLILLDFFR